MIHCHGWMSAVVPLYIKTAYKDEPSFRDAKVVYSVFGDELQLPMGTNFGNCIQFREADKSVLDEFSPECTFEELNKLAAKFSDGVIASSERANRNVLDYAREKGIPVLEYQGDDYASAYADFYDQVWSKDKEE